MLPHRFFVSCVVFITCAVLLLPWPALEGAFAGVTVNATYTYNSTASPHSSPNAFISDPPEEIVFEPNATLEAEEDFDLDVWDSWNAWHEDGANKSDRQDYDLAPLSALTLGSSGYNATLGEGARVISTGESDGITALGEVRIELEKDSLAHGPWAGIALENIAQGSLNSTIVNQGRIGTYENEDGEDEVSDFGIWLNKGDEGDTFRLENKGEGVIKGDVSGVHAVGGSSDIRIIAAVNATIEGGSSGISLGEVDPLAAWAMRPEAYHYFQGDLALDSNATISGTTGIDILGRGASIDITNGENGTIEGDNTGIRYLDSGEGNATIVNRGDIAGTETGIRIAGADVDIDHYGTLDAPGGDAILLDRGVPGGEIELYSGVQGDIRHLGDSGKAKLFLKQPVPGADTDLSQNTIDFGQGRIIQKGTNATTWTLGKVSAGSLLIHNGTTKLNDYPVALDKAINATGDSALTVTGADITTENLRLLENATLNFYSGSIHIDQGELDHSNEPLILGQSDSSKTHLRLDDAKLQVGTNATIRQYGKLSGTGGIHGDLIAANGTLQPGNPTGDIEVTGDFNVRDNATVIIGIKGGEDNSGRIAVNGTANATIEGGTLRVRDETIGQVRDGDRYTYLTAGQVQGNFTQKVDDEPLYDFDYAHNASEAWFIANRLTDYSDQAGTANQKNVARALEDARKQGRLQSLMRAWEKLLADIEQGNAPARKMRKALDQMSPEPYQAASRMTAGQASEMFSRTMRSVRRSRLKMGTGTQQEPMALLGSLPVMADSDPNALGRTLASISDLGRSIAASDGGARIDPDEMGVSAPGSHWRGFYGLYHRQGDIDAGIARTGHEFKSSGVIAGSERNLGTSLTAGWSLGYVKSSVDFDNNRGELETNSFRLASHATYFLDALEFDLAASGGAHFHRQERRMTIPVTDVAKSRYESYDGSLHTGARYRGRFAGSWTLIPSASVQYTHHYLGSHKEGGAGDADLAFESRNERFLRSNLGMSLGREISGEEYVLLPEVFVGWERNLLDEDMEVEASLSGAPGSEFRVTGEGPGRNSVQYGLGITALFWEYNVAYLRYERQRLEEGGSRTFSGGMKWNF